MDELLDLDAVGQAARIAAGDVTPTELAKAAIERLDAVDPTLRAVVWRAPELEAPRGDQGPLWGVPTLLKDALAMMAGAPTTSGSQWLRGTVAPADSELVARMRRAGMVVLGKTATPELGLVPVTEPRLWGPTRNPWDTDLTPGGSSGGSAAAVAARVVALAHGNDGGGSLRIPAACCGLFGLKPTRSRTTLGPFVGELPGDLVVEHALTRSVRDSAAFLDAVHGPMPGDPHPAPPPARPFADEVGTDPGRLRIAFSTANPWNQGGQAHPDCAAAVTSAAELLGELGHDVEDAAPPIPLERLADAFFTVWAAGAAATVDGLVAVGRRPPRDGELEPKTARLVTVGREIPASRYLVATGMVQALSRRLAGWMQRFDLLLTPTLGIPPVRIGHFDAFDDLEAHFREGLRFVPWTWIANLSGQPAMSVPLHWNAAGVPIGAHFLARYGDEATLLRLASQLEQARPWAHRKPPLLQGAP